MARMKKKTLVYRGQKEKKDERPKSVVDRGFENVGGVEECSAGQAKWPQAFGQNSLQGGNARRPTQVRFRH